VRACELAAFAPTPSSATSARAGACHTATILRAPQFQQHRRGSSALRSSCLGACGARVVASGLDMHPGCSRASQPRPQSGCAARHARAFAQQAARSASLLHAPHWNRSQIVQPTKTVQVSLRVQHSSHARVYSPSRYRPDQPQRLAARHVTIYIFKSHCLEHLPSRLPWS